MTELAERPRPWIAKYHPADRCCDASRRMADVLTLHAIAGAAGRYVIIALADGAQVGTLYDTRQDAEARKTHPAKIGLLVPPGGMRAPEAEEVLHYHREVYDQLGGRPLQLGLLMPLSRADQRRQIRALRKR